MTERWRDIPGFEDRYAVSDLGRVYSYRISRCMKLHPKKSGHFKVNLLQRNHNVHRLVLLAFIGPCPEGCESRHLDGNSGNNRLSNLEWATRSRNKQDRKWHRGPNGYQKLTGEQAAELKRRIKNGDDAKKLAEDFGVDRSTIYRTAWGQLHVDA